MNAKVLAAILVPATALSTWLFWPGEKQAEMALVSTVEAPARNLPPSPVPQAKVEMALALEQKNVLAEFSGNGRDRVTVRLQNLTAAPLKITVPVGQMFDTPRGDAMVVVRPGVMELAPGRRGEFTLACAATRTANRTDEAPYRFSYTTQAKLDPLLIAIQRRSELTQGAIQTAILALTENLPLSALAKFTMASTALPSRFNTDAFRVDTLDLMLALTALREAGVPDQAIALTVDPQLRIEAMIDPNTRPIAMGYYGIRLDHEWEFWRHELLNGEPSTRHYALYGIARFYPEVALQMLPRWARETRTNPVYRLAAVQALADTQRPEALMLLRQLYVDLGPSTELGKACATAAEYLNYQLAQLAQLKNSVAFRTSQASGVLGENSLGTIVR